MIAQPVVDWLIPGVIGVGAVLAGSWAGWRFRGRPAPKLLCSCGHGYGTHDPVEGGCGDQVHRSSVGWVDCPCRSYDGPDPLTVR